MLSVPILASILILGVFAVGLSFDDAEAKKTEPTIQVGDQFEIREKGTIVVASDDVFVAEGKAKSKLQLIVREVEDGIASGDARGELSFVYITNDLTGCILPDIDEQRCVLKMKNNGLLSFQYDIYGNSVLISGSFVDEAGHVWENETVVEEINLVSEKAVCSSETANTIGDQLSQSQVKCRVVLLPIESLL